MVFRICPYTRRRCSFKSCLHKDDLGYVHICPRYKKPLGFNKRRFLEHDHCAREPVDGGVDRG